MSLLLLVRHADAGDRDAWRGDDSARPLSPRGLGQAAELPTLLRPLLAAAVGAGPGITVASSPALRCRATVAPLATALGVTVSSDSDLAEGADPDVLRGRLAAVTSPAVWCSHGDVIPALLLVLASEGVDLGHDPRCRKASTWVLELEGRGVAAARYLPPPDPAA